MPTATVDSGNLAEEIGGTLKVDGNLTAPTISGATTITGTTTLSGITSFNAGISGTFIGVGTFTSTAAGVTTITDGAVQTASQVIITPTNSAAGLLTQTKTCWIDTIVAGSFKFNVSATGVGAPAGTETFSYFTMSES